MNCSIFTSTIVSGSMKSNDPAEAGLIARNRATFLEQNGIDPNDTTWVRLTYDRTNYCDYVTAKDDDRGDGITRPSSIISDALVTTEPGHALFLPLADCIAAVIHDPVKNILMVSHLGRHNLEQKGGTESINYLIQHHGAHPKDLNVWLSPAAGVESYPLYSFENRSLHNVAAEQIMTAGVPHDHIEISPIDSATDLNYFSHSQFLAGNRDSDGRFAIVALLR